jgi:hypothetical protein
MTASNYSVSISLNQTTIKALTSSGYSLYTFGAVFCSDSGGQTLVWSINTAFSANISISWGDGIYAYTASRPIQQSDPIYVGSKSAIELGQVMNVEAGGIGEVKNGGVAGGCSILNTTTTEFLCGLCNPVGGAVAPVCVFPLYGGNMQIIAPCPQIFLMFATEKFLPATPVETSYGPGLVVEMSGSANRNVTFDVNQGWAWGNFAWATAVRANSNITSLMIRASNTFTLEAEEATRRFQSKSNTIYSNRPGT